MPVTCYVRDRTLTAVISGEVDHHGAKDIMKELDREIDRVLPLNLIMDLERVTFMDSSGVAVLIRAWRRMGELKGSIRVIAAPPQPAKVLHAAGVDRLIPFR